MTNETKKQFDKWFAENNYTETIDTIFAMPETERDFDILSYLAAAYNNVNCYNKALLILTELKEAGKEKDTYHYRLGYALYHLEEYETSLEAFNTALNIYQGASRKVDATTRKYIDWIVCCEETIAKKQMQHKLNDFTEQPIKIVYSEKSKEFEVVQGAVELGYWGRYTKEDISADFDEDFVENVLSADENDEGDLFFYVPIKPYLHENMTKDEIAEGLSNYYNDRIADIKKHISEINQTFLAYLLYDLCNCGYPIWKECTDYMSETFLAQYSASEYKDKVYTEEGVCAVSELYHRHYETKHNGDAIHDTSAEDIFEKYFPMFDYQKLIDDIIPEYLSFSDSLISIECDGDGQAQRIICGAYAQITAQNAFYDWHNH